MAKDRIIFHGDHGEAGLLLPIARNKLAQLARRLDQAPHAFFTDWVRYSNGGRAYIECSKDLRRINIWTGAKDEFITFGPFGVTNAQTQRSKKPEGPWQRNDGATFPFTIGGGFSRAFGGFYATKSGAAWAFVSSDTDVTFYRFTQYGGFVLWRSFNWSILTGGQPITNLLVQEVGVHDGVDTLFMAVTYQPDIFNPNSSEVALGAWLADDPDFLYSVPLPAKQNASNDGRHIKFILPFGSEGRIACWFMETDGFDMDQTYVLTTDDLADTWQVRPSGDLHNVIAANVADDSAFSNVFRTSGQSLPAVIGPGKALTFPIGQAIYGWVVPAVVTSDYGETWVQAGPDGLGLSERGVWRQPITVGQDQVVQLVRDATNKWYTKRSLDAGATWQTGADMPIQLGSSYWSVVHCASRAGLGLSAKLVAPIYDTDGTYAFVSPDCGQSWTKGLLIDDQGAPSYLGASFMHIWMYEANTGAPPENAFRL